MITNIKRALISVFDKTGVVEFATALHREFGVELISTGGTARALQEAGLPVTLVEEVTGFPELMDGRVKTLHPKIHAAILADRDNPEHLRQLAEQGIAPIDMVVVNLYPFEQTVADPNCSFEQAIEMIDIGGPCLLRAAAKNHRGVVVVARPERYAATLAALQGNEDLNTLRRLGARDVFELTSAYDARVAAWLASAEGAAANEIITLRSGRVTRYGENPHQQGAFYDLADDPRRGALTRSVGAAATEVSFNNYLDAHAAFELCSELSRAHAARPHSFVAPASRRCNEPSKERDAPASRRCDNEVARPSPPSDERWQPVAGERQTRRNLPHIQATGQTYFVTFRLRQGQLAPAERDIALAACHHWHERKATVHVVAVMPDHVHLLVTPYVDEDGAAVPLATLLHSIKSYSAHEVQKVRQQSGPLWLDETWDRIMRHQQEFAETWEYIETNPEAAGLGADYRWVWKSEAGFQEGGEVDGGEEHRRDAGAKVGTKKEHRRDAGATEKEKAHRRDAGATETARGHRRDAGATETEKDHRRDAGATSGRGAGDRPASVVFIKHTNACGAAVGADQVEAYRQAYLGDPNAAMGGILAVDFPVDVAFAEVVMETFARFGKPLADAGHPHPPGAFFVEVWLAPAFEQDAVALIRGQLPDKPQKSWGERVRLLDFGTLSHVANTSPDHKRVAGGLLVQEPDTLGLNADQWQVVSKRQPTAQEWTDLRLAWLVCKHTKSNAISLCRDGMLIGNGAGQMSRVMSCRIATWAARENGHGERLAGAAAASDAFFPFRDGPEILAEAGVTALIQPGGSKRDDEVIAAADERGLAMVFTGTRHFRH